MKIPKPKRTKMTPAQQKRRRQWLKKYPREERMLGAAAAKVMRLETRRNEAMRGSVARARADEALAAAQQEFRVLTVNVKALREAKKAMDQASASVFGSKKKR